MKKEQWIKVLMAMGLTEKRAKEIAELDEAAAEKLDLPALGKEISDGHRALLENDDDFVGTIRQAAVGKTTGEMERWIKQTFAITAEEAKDKAGVALPLKDLIKLAHEKVTANSGKDTATLQQELVAAQLRIKKLEEEDLPAERTKTAQFEKDFTIKQARSKKLVALADKLRVPVEAAEAVVDQYFASEFDLTLDEKGNPVAKIKGKDLLPKSADGTKLLTYDDLLIEKLTASKFLKESNADDVPAAGKGKDGLVVSADDKKKMYDRLPHLTKAQEHIAELKVKPDA